MSHTLWTRKTTGGTWLVDVDDAEHTATVELNGKHLDPHPVPAPTDTELASQGYRVAMVTSYVDESVKSIAAKRS
jgi:hypothetical protein